MKNRYDRRIQEGYIHSYIRGNNKKVIFYDDEDRIDFLEKCKRFAKQFDTKILEFVLMDNHVHLQLHTSKLTLFMKSLLMSYVQTYNYKHKSADKLFKTPFSSAAKHTDEWAIENMLYILKNPVKAGICEYPADFKWSSYGFHYGGETLLKHFINVDTSLIDTFFGRKEALDYALSIYNKGNPAVELKESASQMSSDNESCESEDYVGHSESQVKPKPKKKRKTPAHLRFENGCFFEGITTEKLCEELENVLKGRSLFLLSKVDLEELIRKLQRETRATYKQLAGISNLNYDYVRQICNELP